MLQPGSAEIFRTGPAPLVLYKYQKQAIAIAAQGESFVVTQVMAFGVRRHACTCPLPAIERYRGRISGLLLDRIDLHVALPAITLGELRGGLAGGPELILQLRTQWAQGSITQ